MANALANEVTAHMSKQIDLNHLSQEAANKSNDSSETDNVALIWFTNVAEQIAATTKRLQKAALLGSYFT